MKPFNRLAWINTGNEAGMIQMLVLENLIKKFPKEELTCLEVGSAYGGSVEFGAQLLKGRGRYYGFDTFEGHPKDLGIPGDGMAIDCMDMWYDSGLEVYKRDKLSYEYQRGVLDEEGLDNAILVKGRVNEHSFDGIDKVHFAMIDLDLINPMRTAYEAVKDKIVMGGYLLIHDSLPQDHLPMIYALVYNQIIPEGKWKVIIKSNMGMLTVLERWNNVVGNLNGRLVDLNA